VKGGIYVHIPYCRQACHYCNFHFSTNLKTLDVLVEALCKEIRQKSIDTSLDEISTIYFGGGTPSILSPRSLESIMSSINASFRLSQDVEVTLEANPEDITSALLKGWHQLGVNRLSIGIQSFLEKDLKSMNRVHDATQSLGALELIKNGPITNVSADLMFGLVDSSRSEWESNLLQMLSFDLPHLSVYNLTIEEQTVYAHKLSHRQISLPDDDLQYEQYQLAENILQAHGYEHYEISNYAKEGQRAIHNTSYWDRIPYLGFGPSAHSYLDGTRSWNPANNAKYIKMINDNQFAPSSEVLSSADIYNELIMLGLRRSHGVDESAVKMLGDIFWQQHLKHTELLISSGDLTRQNDRLVLRSDLWFQSDDISSTLFLD